MEFSSPNEPIFGISKHPLGYGFDLAIVKESVIPEVKYAPRLGSERSLKSLRRNHERTTKMS